MAPWYIIPLGKPRIISCAELHAQHVALPRGCFDDVVTCLTDHGLPLSPQCGQGPTASLPVVRRKCQWPVRFQASIEGRRLWCCDWCCIVCPLLCEGRGIAFPGCVGYHALTFKFDDRVHMGGHPHSVIFISVSSVSHVGRAVCKARTMWQSARPHHGVSFRGILSGNVLLQGVDGPLDRPGRGIREARPGKRIAVPDPRPVPDCHQVDAGLTVHLDDFPIAGIGLGALPSRARPRSRLTAWGRACRAIVWAIMSFWAVYSRSDIRSSRSIAPQVTRLLLIRSDVNRIGVLAGYATRGRTPAERDQHAALPYLDQGIRADGIPLGTGLHFPPAAHKYAARRKPKDRFRVRACWLRKCAPPLD